MRWPIRLQFFKKDDDDGNKLADLNWESTDGYCDSTPFHTLKQGGQYEFDFEDIPDSEKKKCTLKFLNEDRMEYIFV